MPASQWYFVFSVHIQGETPLGSTVDTHEAVEIPLQATEEDAAKEQALAAVERLKYYGASVLQVYCPVVGDEDYLTYSDFRLRSPGGHVTRLPIEVFKTSYF